MEKTIAIIPARGGSKRIPKKNLRKFCGKPIIVRVIEILKESDLFNHIVVSTDDSIIADLAKSVDVEVPFIRPEKLSDDFSSTDSVLLHAVRESQKVFGQLRTGCCVYPTSPFLTIEDLKKGLDLLKKYQATSSFPVVKYDFPIEQAFKLDGVRPSSRWPEKMDARSQDLDDYYHDAGMFYWFDVQKYVAERQLFNQNSVAYAMDSKRCQDINTPEDWEHAEIKYRIMQEIK